MRRNTKLRPAGHTFSTDYDGREHRSDTLQCVHCGKHWEVIPGSGRIRGFCTRCNGPTCGSMRCGECVPKEQQLENIEQGKPLFHKPIRVSTSGLIFPGNMQ